MLGTEKKLRAIHGNTVGSQADSPAARAKETAASARAGLVIALLAVILAIGVYVALDAKLTTVAQSVADLPARVSALDTRMATLENLPAKMRRQLVAERLAEMAATAERLTAGVDTDDQKAVMGRISEMARQLQGDLAK